MRTRTMATPMGLFFFFLPSFALAARRSVLRDELEDGCELVQHNAVSSAPTSSGQAHARTQ